jgi:hypothetical protein
MCTFLLATSRTELPGLVPILDLAFWAATPFHCKSIDKILPAVLWIAATDPSSLVVATQYHLTGQFGISFNIPPFYQVRPPIDTTGWRVVLGF